MTALEPSPRASVQAVLAGLFGGLGFATHTFGAPLLLASIAGFCLGTAKPWAGLASLRPVGWMVAGAAPWVLGCMALNGVRFGSLNPISYGPYVWASSPSLAEESLVHLLRHCAPALAWLGGVVLSLAVLHTRPRWCLAVAVLALASLSIPLVRTRTFELLETAYAYQIDMSWLQLNGYGREPDGLGVFLGALVVKTPLQSTPVLGLAFVAPWLLPRHRRPVAMLLLPVAALLLTNALRCAMTEPADRMGIPYLHERYLFASFPILVALTVSVLARFRWTALEIGAVLGLTAASFWLLLAAPHDHDLWRRVLLLRVTLLVCATTALLVVSTHVWPARRGLRAAAKASATVALGLSFSISLAVDLPELLRGR
ncbi:MAG: hypothetical protein EOP08_14010, partial [Proteobacteria bacterium]